MRLLIALIALPFALFSHALSKNEVEHWQQDIDFYAQQLHQHHIDLHHSLPKHYFQQHLRQLKQQLPDLNENQVVVSLMRLTNALGDSHTAFPLWGEPALNSYPIRLSAIAEEYYVTATSAQYQHLLGSRLVAINNLHINDIAAQMADVVPFADNPYSTRHRIAQDLSTYEVLNGLNIAQGSTAQFRFIGSQGEQTETLSTSTSGLDNAQRLSFYNTQAFTQQQRVNDNLWFGASNSNNSIYIRFRRYPAADDMEDFADDVLDFIQQHKSRQLIIDLRDNGGGDFFVGLILAQRLVLADSIDWKSGVFVLTDNVTYSAAMSNAAQYSQILNARLIGEPTGAQPSGYQDMGMFTLPNSKWQVSYSKRLYRFASTDADALYPDVLIERSITDYLSEKDSALDRVIQHLQGQNTF
ncbi:peptidase S41 [Bacterioplanes sanyensis]|uniref:Peptidase S41 n=1 Tax=Bacterioplanes sanyensis TaxID=1249553 RepID=A0A222FLI3_9GAMM|nr:hypothetical protein [Bacterioplanes sanyensis]ASP39532.1 peptidase S41 [Bacterioplanes sanyensis]